jgi:hypothetical protein
MRRAAAILVFLAASVSARVTWTTAAAVSTIAVNVLDIKQTVSKAVKAAKAVKKGTVKAARKVAGK